MNAVIDVSKIKINTDRLILRAWQLGDLEDFYEYAKVDGVGQMAGWNPHTSINETKEILDMFIENKVELAIVLKDNNKVIGSIGILDICYEISEKFKSMSGREIGYTLSKDYWGRGLMPEAVSAVIEYCFKVEKMDFLQCSHSYSNNQSRRVIEKTGFTYATDMMRTAINGKKGMSRFYFIKNNI